MRRREFITLLGGAAALSPFAAHAQQADRVRRVGILLTFSDDDPEAKAWLAAFRQGLERRGWWEGRNLHIDIRSASARGERIPGLAKELIALQPEVLLAQSTAAARALQRETQTLPIVFVHVSDPIGAGIVSSLARPEANLTGVLHYEAGIVGKWLAMLKEMSPRLARVAVLANSKTTAFDYFLRSAQGAASSLGIEVIPSSKAPPISSAPLRNSHACPIAACCCRRMPRPFCIRISSSGLRRGTGCPRFIRCRSSSRPVA
jgi:putative ABC transport system substrate-binding protein